VARVRDILDRFRPAGAPGGATGAGVPVDRQQSLTDEVATVFADLEPTIQECARIAHEADEQAQRREKDAQRRAHDLVARARSESEAERAGAAAAVRARAASESERILADARQQAQQVRRRADERRPRLLARVVELVRADLRAFADSDGGTGDA
jgi:vacuolar-type H+-ATPase subunit H